MNPTTPHVIIYSHDFGVRKSDRGLFTAVANAMPDAESIMFDYYPIHEASSTLTAKPLDEQALKLRKVINNARAEFPEATIDLVCHGQGCVVAGLLKTRGLRKVIMLAPPEDTSEAKMTAQVSAESGEPVDIEARTRLQRSNGTAVVIHPEYWQSLADIEPVKLYNRLAKFTKLRIMNARQDEILGEVNMDGLDPGISRVTFDGNHNFEAEADRSRIVYILQKELARN